MRGSIPRRSPRPARVDAGSQVEPRMVSRSLSDHPPALGACQRRSHRIDRGMAREFARFGRSARACPRPRPSGFGSGPPMPGCHAWHRPGRRIRRVATGRRRRRETAARTRRIRGPATFTAHPEETVRAVASRTPAARRAFCRHSITDHRRAGHVQHMHDMQGSRRTASGSTRYKTKCADLHACREVRRCLLAISEDLLLQCGDSRERGSVVRGWHQHLRLPE